MRHAARHKKRRSARIGAALASTATVATTGLAAAGVIGVQPLHPPIPADPSADLGEDALADRSRAVVDRSQRIDEAAETPPSQAETERSSESNDSDRADSADDKADSTEQKWTVQDPPEHSGKGKRIVYALEDNHVWLVNADNEVLRDYEVSGTKYDQIDPGTYSVLRKRLNTTSYHGTETMRYMVTFLEGENAAIGFHDIPLDIETGEPIQTKAQLGESLSAGCVRQLRPDAKALWEFAPVDTKVVVLA
jgi:lipoprotein-anchoring transpeptidase ErfK/SrfK